MSTRGWWFLAAVFLVGVPPASAQTESFPIGAWFPGMQGARVPPTAAEKRAWAARLDAVKAAGFNTIHGAQGRGELRKPEFNQPWMDLALKVHLGSWRQPPVWRRFSSNYWARTFEVEEVRAFTSPIGAWEVTEEDGRVAWYAEVKKDDRGHDPGLLLDSRPNRIYLRRNDTAHFGHHFFWLKTDDAAGNDHIATIRVLSSDGTVMDSTKLLCAAALARPGSSEDAGPLTCAFSTNAGGSDPCAPTCTT